MKQPATLAWSLLSSVLAGTFTLFVVLAALGLGLGQGLKQVGKAIDSRLFAGRLMSLYKPEHLPEAAPPPPPAAYDWLGDGAFLPIAHGLGPMLWGGINSRATFEEGRRRGFHVFEVDLTVTTDHRLVCFHGEDERELDAMSAAQFVAISKRSGVEPVEFTDLVGWAQRYPDTRFILDVKNRFDEAYRLARLAIGLPSLGQSFIPQVYTFDQLAQFRGDHFFAGEIFTSYRSHLSTGVILKTAERLQVRAVTLTRQRVDDLSAAAPSVAILVHPVDDAFDAARLRVRGVRGIYTSYVTPLGAPEVFAPWPNGCIPEPHRSTCRFAPEP